MSDRSLGCGCFQYKLIIYSTDHVEVKWHSRVRVRKLQSVRPRTRKLTLYTGVYIRVLTSTFRVQVQVRASSRAKLRVCEYSYECGQVREFVLVLESSSCCSCAVA